MANNARSKQLAYFRNNIQTKDDQDEFDASQYYYNRDDLVSSTVSSSALAIQPTSSHALYRSNTPQLNGFANVQQQAAVSQCLQASFLRPKTPTETYTPSSDLRSILSNGLALSSQVTALGMESLSAIFHQQHFESATIQVARRTIQALQCLTLHALVWCHVIPTIKLSRCQIFLRLTGELLFHFITIA